MSDAVSWENAKRAAHECRKAAGLPVRTPAAKQAAMNKILSEMRAYKLAEVRQEQSLTQREVAASMGVSAPRVSAIEHGMLDRAELATLRSYVEALGGILRVVADFGDTEYTVA